LFVMIMMPVPLIIVTLTKVVSLNQTIPKAKGKS